MSQPLEDYKRDGLNSLVKFAKLLCGIVQSFEPVIRAKYGDQVGIIALLDAIKTACSLLPDAEAEMAAFPSDDPAPPVDTSMIPGINPSAPPAPDPIII